MITKQISRFFKRERKNTDDSLIAERNKATQSLKVANFKSQGQTDEIVKDERSIADQKTASSRAHHDDLRDDSLGKAMSQASQGQLAEERRRTDLATELERTKVDAAILKEREIASRLVNKVLELERQATDENLSVERSTTDTGFDNSSQLLKSEVKNHARTKTSLTSRDEFLAIVSHDLKNPIGAVSSYAELLIEGIEGEAHLGPTAKSFVQAIKRNADISLRLIADLLDVERISSGKLELRKQIIETGDLLREAIERFQPRAKERSIHLSLNGDHDAQTIECDRDRILQVLGNLLSNALKFTPEHGRVSLSAQKSDDGIVFSINDSGPGIPDSKKQAIFERFAQLKSRNRDGLGLGLYISKMLVEGHEGKLWVESTEGHGSTFKFRLPPSAP